MSNISVVSQLFF